MEIVAQAETEKLQQAIATYMQFTRRTSAEVMDAKGNDLRQALRRRFKAIEPARGKIPADARARGYRMRRRRFGSVSPYAERLAEKTLGGNKQVYGSVTQGAGAAGILRTVRIGQRGQRITGGRHGRGGRAATMAEAMQFKNAGEKPLNKPALAAYFETMLRERGRGYLSSGFLLLRRQRGTASERASGRPYRLVARTVRTAFPFRISERLAVSADGAVFSIDTDQEGIAERQQIVAAAFEDVRSDTIRYVEMKLAQYAKKAGLQ